MTGGNCKYNLNSWTKLFTVYGQWGMYNNKTSEASFINSLSLQTWWIEIL